MILILHVAISHRQLKIQNWISENVLSHMHKGDAVRMGGLPGKERAWNMRADHWVFPAFTP